MVGLLGKKIGMTRIFDADGRQVPVTVIECGPCYVSALKTAERDGYTGVQLAFEKAKEKRVTKPVKGHYEKSGVAAPRYVREIRTEQTEGLKLGSELRVNQFEVGDYVDVEGTSKGKGFQGVVKRHGFSGGESAHGSKFGREPGSIGQSATPSRVHKGRPLPGQMGNERVTVQNLKVVEINEENNLLIVEGAIPGSKQGYVVVKSSFKKTPGKEWNVVAEETPQEEVNPEVPQEEVNQEVSEEQPEAPASEEQENKE